MFSVQPTNASSDQFADRIVKDEATAFSHPRRVGALTGQTSPALGANSMSSAGGDNRAGVLVRAEKMLTRCSRKVPSREDKATPTITKNHKQKYSKQNTKFRVYLLKTTIKISSRNKNIKF